MISAVPRPAHQCRQTSKSDVGMNFGLLLCMIGAAFLVDVREGHGERVLGEFLFFTVILVFVIALGVLGHTGYRRLQPERGFGVFLRCCPCGGRCGLLCHHKVATTLV